MIGSIGPMIFYLGGLSAQASYQYTKNSSLDLEVTAFGVASLPEEKPNLNVTTEFISLGTSYFPNQYNLIKNNQQERVGPMFFRFSFSFHNTKRSKGDTTIGRLKSNGAEIGLGFRMKAAKVAFEVVPIVLFIPVGKRETEVSTQNKGSNRFLQLKVGVTF